MKLLIICMVGSFLFSCKKPEIKEYEPWGFKYPGYFPAPVYTFNGDKLMYNKFVLGRALFYDPLLSSDSTISCASCHSATHGFGGHNTPFSEGVNNLLGTRNSPGIFNLAWNPAFMWDGGINHIEIMPAAPLTNPVEMNETISNILYKLSGSSKYKTLFKNAYGTDEITEQRMLKSMAQFLTMIISDHSKYDKVKQGTEAFTADEQSGYELFVQKCSQCHKEPLFTDYSYRNNGLDTTPKDLGRAMITQLNSDKGKFKVPSLRNIELTYPYMHDGRHYKLEDVLNHYAGGVKQSATLDPALKDGIPLTSDQKKKLIAFLKTLTDYEMMKNPFLTEPTH